MGALEILFIIIIIIVVIIIIIIDAIRAVLFMNRPQLSPRRPVSSLLRLSRLTGSGKLQALVYDILPSTTAVFSYAIGSRKLSANEQFQFLSAGAQTLTQ